METARLRAYALQTAIVLTPLAYATVHPLPIALFQSASYGLFLWWAVETAARKGDWVHLRDPLLLIAGGAIILGLFQLIPLPNGFLAVLSPGTHYWAIESLADSGIELPRYRPISLAPYHTVGGILWISALACWYAIAQEAARDRVTARRLVLTLALTGAGLGFLGLLQRLTGAPAIFWAYFSFDKPRTGFFSTFINPNNAAGVLTLGTMACLACMATAEIPKRPLWGGAAVLAAGGAIFSLSRGGIGILVFALLFTLWLLRYRRDSTDVRPLWLRLGPLYFGAALIAFVTWIGWTDVLGELETVRGDTGLNGRVQIWSDSLRGIVPVFPLFGAGYGTFEALYPAYATKPSVVTYTAIENEYLHALIEGGLIGALLALGIIVELGRRMRKTMRKRTISRAQPFMMAGTCALAAHMLLDFPLHQGGPALWIITSGALAVGGAQSTRRRSKSMAESRTGSTV